MAEVGTGSAEVPPALYDASSATGPFFTVASMDTLPVSTQRLSNEDHLLNENESSEDRAGQERANGFPDVANVLAPANSGAVVVSADKSTWVSSMHKDVRGIRVSAKPVRVVPSSAEGSRPGSSSSATLLTTSTADSVDGLRPALRATGKPSQQEGILAKFHDWVDGNLGARRRPRYQAPAPMRPGVPPDFTAPIDSPDRRRLTGGETRRERSLFSERRSLEDQWRAECLTAARSRSLKHVEEMRILYYTRDIVHLHGHDVIVVAGAHYRAKAVPKEDLLLHCVKEVEKVGGRPFVVLYLNADAQLNLFPDTIFFTELHAALLPSHRRQLRAIYVLHPSPLLRTWIFLLKLQEPHVYSKVMYVDRMKKLMEFFHPDVIDSLPEFCRDHDNMLPSQ